MQFKNSPSRYGLVTKAFHWTMALLIIFMLCLGLWMTGLENSLLKLQRYNLHKSIGVLVLALALGRVLWHLYSKKPPFDPALKWWERNGAHVVHGFLYFAMLGMPLTGWLMSSAGGRAVNVFGFFTLPDLVAQDDNLRNIFAQAHAVIAYTLIGAIAVHFAAAMKHHFITRDSTLRRMIPFGKTGVILALLFFSATVQAAGVKKWTVIPSESSIVFSGTQMGKDFSGRFKKFDADISFDAAHLDQSRVAATVDLASFDSSDKDRDNSVTSKEWFDTAQFPAARFETTGFTGAGTSFETTANLTIKGVTVPVHLPFTLSVARDDSGKEKAVMRCTVTLDRMEFKLGEGEWADPAVIGAKVRVEVTITASAPPA